jgi:hypothetical protein
LVLLTVAVAVCSLHRGALQEIEFAFLEARLGVSGAEAEDFFRLAERVFYEGGSPETVERLCLRVIKLKPGDEWRSGLLFVKAHFQPDILREMDADLATGDGLARAGQFEDAKREYWQVLERDLAYSTRGSAERAERARTGPSRLPSPPWTRK